MTKTRYLVEWTPWAAVKAAALKAGMPKDGEVSDFVEIADYDDERAFPSFVLALGFARKVEPADTWRCPRIRRQFLVRNDHDDLGNPVEATFDWENDATWEVLSDLADPVEERPDWRDAA